jgi:hypothetical protein
MRNITVAINEQVYHDISVTTPLSPMFFRRLLKACRESGTNPPESGEVHP